MAQIKFFASDGDARLLAGLAKFPGQGFGKLDGGFGQQNPVLRALGASHGGLDAGQVKLKRIAENRLLRAGLQPQALRLGIGLDQGNTLWRAARRRQEVDRGLADWEKAAGCAIFRGHIGNGGLVFEGQGRDALAIKLDKLTHHTLFAQHLGNG